MTTGSPALRARLKRAESLGDRVMKVNHAGEQGAVELRDGRRLVIVHY